MKCHMCGEELVCDSIDLWNVAPRRCVAYACRNRVCRPPPNVSTDSSAYLQVIEPDKEINYYCLRFPHRDKWYQVASIEIQCNPGETTFSVAPDTSQASYDPLFTLPRFIPLLWGQPLEPQVEVLKEKLKTLLYFI